MDLLPLEALNIIAENQTLYELSASSTVNPYCNADMAEYLKTAECRVYPRFESPELEESTETKNRTLYVLAASSAVSVGRRGSFNQNWMWWQQCIADTTEYLETAECRVQPRFESLESEDSTQTCLYKRTGDKKITIKESL
ncbi:hypothetical protein J6590_083200 [Homalodisca vitripennis]|nr:hypothetical protein J6590_083200 [Homalodisca vitripennis]